MVKQEWGFAKFNAIIVPTSKLLQEELVTDKDEKRWFGQILAKGMCEGAWGCTWDLIVDDSCVVAGTAEVLLKQGSNGRIDL